MDRSSFEKSVTILTGLGTPTRIESAAEAYALLADWPRASRTAAHDIAAKACRAAMDGESATGEAANLPPLRGRCLAGQRGYCPADLGLYCPSDYRLTRDFSQRSKATARIRIRPMTMLCV